MERRQGDGCSAGGSRRSRGGVATVQAMDGDEVPECERRELQASPRARSRSRSLSLSLLLKQGFPSESREHMKGTQ